MKDTEDNLVSQWLAEAHEKRRKLTQWMNATIAFTVATIVLSIVALVFRIEQAYNVLVLMMLCSAVLLVVILPKLQTINQRLLFLERLSKPN